MPAFHRLAPSGDPSETIIAPATAAGESGVSILRLSGPGAAAALRRWFVPARARCRWSSHRLYFGEIQHPRTHEVIDRGLAVLMRAPRSYTGEDTAELHCHGSPHVVQEVLNLAWEEGIRLARPGEFTLRAVLNGRLDLAQAESLLELITARSERALRQANAGVSGAFSAEVDSIRKDLVQTQAFVEASIDFSEDEIPAEDVLAPLDRALTSLASLHARAKHGLLYRTGVRVALIGRPNVGKSSLLNALLRSPRAIVSELPGTTRDTIEESTIMSGIPMVLTDTAGIRETDDLIESLGVARTREAIAVAVVRVLVLDRSDPLSEDDRRILDDLDLDRTVVVLNKSDLPMDAHFDAELPRNERVPIVEMSALTGNGLQSLEQALVDVAMRVSGSVDDTEIMLAVPRHVETLDRAIVALRSSLQALRSAQPFDIVAGELSLASRALGEITGVNATEDLFDTIFSRFCLGK
ncbi:MAG: tRNA uridine-5-carboxymethylaminomethyl(34) synthesis GTPase MnmE [Chloroflexota bacterium]